MIVIPRHEGSWCANIALARTNVGVATIPRKLGMTGGVGMYFARSYRLHLRREVPLEEGEGFRGFRGPAEP